MHEVVKRILALGWGGLENLALIPGTVGGAVVQNIGAYGAEVAQFVRSIKVYDPAQDAVKEFTNENCDFAYRHSVFKTEEGSGLIVLSVTLAFDEHWKPNLSYKELANAFTDVEPTPESISKRLWRLVAVSCQIRKCFPVQVLFLKTPSSLK